MRILRPVDSRVVHIIVVVCELNENAKLDRAFGNSSCQFIEQVVCAPGRNSRIVQMVVAGFWHDPVASIAADAVLVGKVHRRHAEIRLSGEAGWSGLRCLHKFERLGISSEERFDWGWRWL